PPLRWEIAAALKSSHDRSAQSPARSGGDAGAHPHRLGWARGFMDLRLRLADLAAGVRLRRAAAREGAWLASRAEDVEPHQPRHARAAGPRVRLALRRIVPGRRVPHPEGQWTRSARGAVGARDEAGGVRPEMAH